MVRVLQSAFELSHLPNRAELRLKSSGKVIGYTLSHVRDERGRVDGRRAVLQGPDAGRAAGRARAAARPPGGARRNGGRDRARSEEPAGRHRGDGRRAEAPGSGDSADAQSILTDIINEAKMANQIVHEALEFVRPIRLQVERTSIADVINDSVNLAETKMPRRNINLQLHVDEGLPPIQGDHHQLCQLFTNLLINAFEALEGTGTVDLTAREGAVEEETHGAAGERTQPMRTVVVDVADDGPGVPRELTDRIFNAFFTTKPQGSGPRPRHRAQSRRRARRHDRHSQRRSRHAFQGDVAGFRRGRLVHGESGAWRRAKINPGLDGRRGRQMGRILIADDHDALRRGLARALTTAGHEVEEAPNGNQAIERLHEGHFDVVLSDLKMGGSDGLDVLRTTKTLHPSTAVILMTAFGSVHTAVEAMKSGAFDYVQKPFEIEEMEVKIEKALEMRRMRHELDYLRHTQNDIYDFDRIVGASSALQRVLGVVRKVAKSNTTVLIRGETGTGKELIAGAIHHNSLRAARNFVKVNCAALPETLLESELFGHEKGAYTGADRQRIGRFEQADGGSLFLDEIGDMSPAIQAKILRVLQEHEFERLGGTRTQQVDVRLITATNRDLSAMVAAGACSAKTCTIA